MRRLGLALLFVLLPGLASTGCRGGEAPAPDAAHRHPLEGTVVAVEAADRKLTIAHEDIPGFMPAMTMEFVVLQKDAVLLDHISPGDRVTATLVAPDSRYWLEDLVVVKKAARNPNATPGPQPHFAQPGDPMPDVALVDQDGHAFRLAAYRGKALALTFIFTRCPFPEFCPLMMKNFAAVEDALRKDAALGSRTHLLTVSFDPRHDTPPVLRSFGLPFQKTKPPFDHWTLATGKDDPIRRLAEALELEYVEESRSFTHNLRTAVVGPDGHLVKLFRGNDWSPDDLVAELRTAAAR
jgi:protein SCO1/2